MSTFKNIFATLWPPFRHKLDKQSMSNFLHAIARVLPDEFADVKLQLTTVEHSYFMDPHKGSEFRLLSGMYKPAFFKSIRKHGIHFDLVGMRMFCTTTQRFETFEITVRENMCAFWKCSKPDFKPADFDLQRIDCSALRKVDVEVPPSEVELFIATLPVEIQALIDVADLEEIEFNNRTFYAFYDLEDGNWLAFDKKGAVYSIVHDAKPATSKMKISLAEILQSIADKRFDGAAHLEERYRKSK